MIWLIWVECVDNKFFKFVSLILVILCVVSFVVMFFRVLCIVYSLINLVGDNWIICVLMCGICFIKLSFLICINVLCSGLWLIWNCLVSLGLEILLFGVSWFLIMVLIRYLVRFFDLVFFFLVFVWWINGLFFINCDFYVCI